MLFLSANNRGGAVTARIEVDAQQGTQVRRKEITVQDGDDLEDETGRAVYKNCRIGEIRVSGDSSLLAVKTDGSETFISVGRSEEHTSDLQSLMRISYAVFCLQKKTQEKTYNHQSHKSYTLKHI